MYEMIKNQNYDTIPGLTFWRNVLLFWTFLLVMLISLASFGNIKSTSIQKAKIQDKDLILSRELEEFCDQNYGKEFDLYISYGKK